jgi:hypothetical protein
MRWRCALVALVRWRAWNGVGAGGPRTIEVSAPLGVLPYFEAYVTAGRRHP